MRIEFCTRSVLDESLFLVLRSQHRFLVFLYLDIFAADLQLKGSWHGAVSPLARHTRVAVEVRGLGGLQRGMRMAPKTQQRDNKELEW